MAMLPMSYDDAHGGKAGLACCNLDCSRSST